MDIQKSLFVPPFATKHLLRPLYFYIKGKQFTEI